jgi:hypothetical protein
LAGNSKAVEIEKTRAAVEDRPVSREKAIKIARFYKTPTRKRRDEINAVTISNIPTLQHLKNPKNGARRFLLIV